jgi:hypothetical protein
MAVFALIAIFAKDCFDLVLVHELDFPNVFRLEFELVVLSNDLEFVWKLMGAYFIDIKQVYGFFLFANMEIPDAVQLSTQTVHWLIGLYKRLCTLLMIKVLEEKS